jgi:hypothetical protein
VAAFWDFFCPGREKFRKILENRARVVQLITFSKALKINKLRDFTLGD